MSVGEAVGRSAWPAPRATGPVDAVVRVPGSKSVTNRALVLAALADGVSVLRRPLRSRDTLLMAAALRGLGARIEDAGDDWVVTGSARALPAVADAIDVGNAGTVARFLPPIATLAKGSVRFDGDPRVRQRPLAPLLTALRALGANIDDDGRGGLPATVHGAGGLRGGAVSIDASASSQLVSGLLLAAPRFDQGIDLRHVGPPVPSARQLAMTIDMLRERGAIVDDTEPDRWQVAPGPLSPYDVVVEPDLSSAAPFLLAAVATRGRIQIPDWPRHSHQPGARLPELLEEMGASTRVDDDGLTVCGDGAGKQRFGLSADLHDCGELAPVLAAVAPFASSPTRLVGIAHLRLQETDRLAAIARELARLGGDVWEIHDGLLIWPKVPHGGLFRTYDDHRLAMAAAVLGLLVDGVEIENVATTGKTLPGFTTLWTDMLAGRGGGVH